MDEKNIVVLEGQQSAEVTTNAVTDTETIPTELKSTSKGSATSCRKVQLIIMNPKEKELFKEWWDNPNAILEYVIAKIPRVQYACASLEYGLEENKTEHIHIFICSDNIYLKNVTDNFPNVHYEKCKGSCEANRNYLFKIGKWADSPKAEERIENMQFEYGEMPDEKQGKRNDLNTLYNLILEGKSNAEIYALDKKLMSYANSIDRIRQDLMRQRYRTVWRNLTVTYVWGPAGAGKTRSIMDLFGYGNVYRINDYVHPYDSYCGEPVIVFEEFRSDLRVSEMLQVLDGYPCELRARYANRQACFTQVFFSTNIDLWEQYRNIQENEWETFKAFIRRIHGVRKYLEDGSYIDYSMDAYIFETATFEPAKKIDLIKTVNPNSIILKSWKITEDGKAFELCIVS